MIPAGSPTETAAVAGAGSAADANCGVTSSSEAVVASQAEQIKRDAAARKLDELREAGADRWERVKDGVGTALDDLKKVFE